MRGILNSRFENSRMAITVWDGDLRLVTSNAFASALLQCPKELLVPGVSLETLIRNRAECGEYGVNDVEEQVRRRIDGARCFEPYSFERTRLDGTSIEVKGTPLPDGGVAVCHYDITERKQIEADLRRSEERFRDISESASDWIWEMGPDLRFTYISERLTEETGIRPEERIGTKREDRAVTFETDDEAKNWAAHLEDLQARRPFKHFEYVAAGIGGERRYVSTSGRPFFDGDGNFLGYRGMATDITKRKRAEDALRASQEQLAHALKMEAIGQLTGGVAHDFNNLLTGTMTNAQMLVADLEDREDLRDMAKAIVTASKIGADLIHRLLAYSRRQTLRPKLIQLRSLSEEMLEFLVRGLGETVKINLAVKDKLWNVMADRGQIESALLNLAINASHAMPNGGNIGIMIENVVVTSHQWAQRWQGTPGEYVALRVIDTGMGIPRDVLEHVFEPFFSTKEVGQGSGLGLSMVHGFAQQSHGFVTIDSEEGKGTTVTIYLPKAPADRTIGETRLPDAETDAGPDKTVLVVGDALAAPGVTIRLLKKLGFTVLTAKDGAGALQIACGGRQFDLLLLDIVLPGGQSGIEICKQIREQLPNLKCLFMTGHASPPDEDLPEYAEILSEPILTCELATKLRQVLGP